MDTIQAHFENEAKAYDDNIQKLIPYYNQMIEALVWTIPFERQKKIRVIDLGCGTGTVAKCIKDAFPDAHITCLDFTENMLKLSKMKLGNQPNFRFEASDFNHYQFHSTYDVIVSSLALHHLESDQDKICFYQKIYNCLAKEGVFYNADIMLGSTEYIHSVYMKKWKSFMLKHVSEDEIDNEWIPRYYAEDKPVSIKKHFEWLTKIGYKKLDVIWKYYGYAVYGGIK